ncbi:Phosphatidate phosphatase PAH2 [Abeliophyllum distichum]|uniref:Phosphatidate phosphatase PAH2 n=1 Tax=Abeliophyllum distichum TaxID=126358 RepID=A0ABD1TIU6_9LAMI
MQAVGKLGSYISRSVYTVSGPFHPFGGAVDIVVVEQPDGSYKSSPWYVRFGKFQGVLKTKEKVVSISVNGIEANFHMYLDHKGAAYFLREVDVEEGTSSFSPPSSSSEDMDWQLGNRRPMKSKSCSCDADSSGSILNGRNRNAMVRTNSSRSQILGLVFGRKSMKEDGIQEEVDGSDVVRINSLERAEIAADLLELKWSTNIASARRCKDNASRFSARDKSKDEVNRNFLDDVSLYNEIGIISHSSYQKLENTVAENNAEEVCVSKTSTSIESVKEDTRVSNSETSSMTEILDLAKADYHGDSETIKSEITSPDSQIANSVEKHNGSSDTSVMKEENGTDRIQSFCYGTCESSKVGLDGAAERSNGTFSCDGCGEVCVNAKTTHFTTELTSAVKSGRETDMLFGEGPLNLEECLGNGDHFSFFIDEKDSETEGTSLNSTSESIAAKSHYQVVSLHPSNDSIEEVEPLSGLTISSFSNSACPHEEKRTIWKEDKTNKYGSCSGPQGNPQISISDEAIPAIPMSEISEEEQLLFGDLDDSNFSNAKDMDTIYPNHEKEMYSPLLSMMSNGVDESFPPECSPTLYPDESVIDDTANDAKESTNAPDLDHSFIQSSRSDVKSGINNNLRLPRAQSIAKDIEVLEELKEGLANPSFGNAPRPTDSLSRSRRSWSLSFKRSRIVQVSQPAVDGVENYNVRNIPRTTDDMEGEKDVLKLKVNKKKMRTLTPTSEQLASLNLKEGRNIVIFTFSTAMLGKQQVDARVYLWRWDTKIVISDVDGTITRSDLLGQVMPWVGMDWSQTGVVHLFSAIEENGYQLLFLSARSISQAYNTRQFLFNLKQNGKALPDGPVVISPDGLFPSLFREVVRRAPHEFKIACLEDIRALFPSDRNPFYAGFGNRDTDEFSYLKVGIPIGKIFIINPKGEIVVNRRTHTESYTSLFDLVHGMFPSMSSSEQEDFNSWNYWKLPPPLIDV